jgi:hypothetical protein
MYAIQSPQQPQVGDLKTVTSNDSVFAGASAGVAAGLAHATSRSISNKLNETIRVILFPPAIDFW